MPLGFRLHPGGMPAISRGLRTAPPPVNAPRQTPIPEGSQPVRSIVNTSRLNARWHPFGMRVVSGWMEIRWCRSCLAPPPANS